jgi:hypothetical protein
MALKLNFYCYPVLVLALEQHLKQGLSNKHFKTLKNSSYDNGKSKPPL